MIYRVEEGESIHWVKLPNGRVVPAGSDEHREFFRLLYDPWGSDLREYREAQRLLV